MVEGQIQGGVAQGVGGAYYERLVYDAEGQLRNASFMEFLMPYATEIPAIEIDHIETPSPLNPLGVKGLGEGGVMAPPPALAAAVEDALRPLGVRIDSTPLSAPRVRRLIEEARG